jgi:hypothetical protein
MEISEVTYDIYRTIINTPSHAFNSAEFNNLNSLKIEKLYYLIFKDTKYRLGIILGVRNKVLISPFSASFGGFESVNNEIKLYQIDTAIEVLILWSKQNKFDGINLVCPPSFYDSNFYTKVSNCLFRAGFETINTEINYHFESSNLNENYLSSIWHNARKNLKKSLSYSLVIRKVEPSEEIEVYNIIAQNRKERGFPLRLSFEQIKEIESIIPIDYFLVNDINQSVAAAIVFHLSSKVVRVVYWGDLPKFSEYKTMNFLSYKIFKYYKDIGISFVDIGHSTVDSIPNHGLCEFKESIGCSLGLLKNYYKKI